MTIVVGLAALKKPLQLAKPLNAAPPPQQPLILLLPSKCSKIFDRNTNNSKWSISNHVPWIGLVLCFFVVLFGLVVKVGKVERCKNTEGPTWRNAASNFLQKNFFLQVRLLFYFNQTLPQGSQTLQIRKQMNIRKVLFSPIFATSCFYTRSCIA